MTRTEQLTEARSNQTAARLAFETAATKTARRNAAEQLEFWGNKVAFLANTKGWA